MVASWVHNSIMAWGYWSQKAFDTRQKSLMQKSENLILTQKQKTEKIISFISQIPDMPFWFSCSWYNLEREKSSKHRW